MESENNYLDFGDKPKQHFEQILKNVSSVHDSYKEGPEWWNWTQAFKFELDNAMEQNLLTQEDFEQLRLAVKEQVNKDRSFYKEAKEKLVDLIGEENYKEWWIEEEK